MSSNDRKELFVDFDWKKIKAEYVTTDKSSYRKLAEKYGIPLGTLYKRAGRENWSELKKQSGIRTVAKQISAIEEKQVDKMKRIQDITDKLLDKIEKAVDELDIQLAKTTKRVKVIEYDNSDRPDKPTKETVNETENVVEYRTIIDRKGAHELASAIKSLKEVQMLKSELDEEEQRARIEKLRKETEDEQKDTSVVVKFEGEIDKWSK
jgi:hypothetical protein